MARTEQTSQDAQALHPILQARFRAFLRASAHLLAAHEAQVDPRELHEALQCLRQGLHARVAHLLAAAEAQLDLRERERERKSHFPVFEFAIARLS